jgi:hypothetical protein
VVAHVQAPASTSATARLGRVAGDEAVVHAGERADGEADAVGEEGEGDAAEDDERDAEREEGVHGERGVSANARRPSWKTRGRGYLSCGRGRHPRASASLTAKVSCRDSEHARCM